MSTKIMELNSLGPIDVARSPRAKSPERTVSTPPAAASKLWRISPQRWRVAQWLVGPFAILLITEFSLHAFPVNTTAVGFAFLLAILITSTRLELRAMVLMCIAASAAYDYFFLPPVGTFNIDDPQDWVALFSFLITALIGTTLATRSRNKAKESNLRRAEVERLYSLSQRLLSARNPTDLIRDIPRHVAAVLAVEFAALYFSDTQEVFSSKESLSTRQMNDLRTAACFSEPQVTHDGSASFSPIRLGDLPFGSLGLFGPPPSRETFDAVAALVAAAIARARALERVAKMEASRESERLKSVLLDAITHDFRTPLTSIKISATGLLDDLELDRPQRKELLVIIDEECDRISKLVGEAAEMARLECGELKLDIASHTVSELISTALDECKNLIRDREVSVNVEQPERLLPMDLPLTTKVLVHLINNAHLYSSTARPITVRTEERDGCEFISVCDQGPGIDKSEIGAIFEKFYRGKNQRHRVQGTGMGLPIAKAIVEAHGGSISATSSLGNGSVFTFSLPIEPRVEEQRPQLDHRAWV